MGKAKKQSDLYLKSMEGSEADSTKYLLKRGQSLWGLLALAKMREGTKKKEDAKTGGPIFKE